jgi:hypothetical protein
MTRGPSGPASRRVLEGMVPTKDHSIADSRPDKRNDQRRTEAHPGRANTSGRGGGPGKDENYGIVFDGDQDVGRIYQI